MTDESRAQDVIAGCSNWFDIQHYIVPRIVTALTTVRQEERRAAIAALTGLPAQGTMNYRRGYEEGVRDAIRTLEATANDQKAPHGEQP